MARSKCASCGSQEFEVVHATNLKGSERSLLFVQCSACGTVIGVLDFVNLSVQVNNIKEDLRRTAEKLRAQFERL